MLEKVKAFFQSDISGGILLFIFAISAMAMANSSLSDVYFSFLDTPVQLKVGSLDINKPLLLWVNDGLMAIFFLLVGLEVKRELMEGALSSYQKAIFPAIAAVGGMIVPALVYKLVTANHPEFANGWAIPMATDIAFALGVIALLSKRVPLALKIFLLALAIIDDLGAIVVIAIFFSHDLSTQALVIAAIAITLLIIANRLNVTALDVYVVIGIILWVSVLKSGVHATLAGVIIGFAVPLQVKKGKRIEKPLHKFEHILVPWSSFIILPLFAFSNAGVYLGDVTFSELFSALPLAITLGLILGKTIGVFSFSYIAVKTGIAKLPHGINFKQIFAVSVLCGIGFTMSMFLSSLAFGSTEGHMLPLARLGILIGSLVSAVLGYFLLKTVTKPTIR
ncbi:sodium/proton antiporter (NhaA family) [Cricetibacter osteomyelitidis]|uniref:Na(+)/H(+) antiporter NhaA n=1 Tax=Cricetibacter osteomyelitidis TaxID=1521931 RepID=A0A4R2TBV8_9PAST|nr:Na+/H+ antiporter NhaA [Cricetibacter osteomyelitidis]TCP92212.1 sodium/proton antiporter (NhaA family) [Cricetibacter osteomyelitidis]